MTPGDYILTADIGTSSTKVVLYTPDGQVTASAGARYQNRTPHSGWAEANPEDWWGAFSAALDELGRSHDLQQVHTIVLTGQMHTAVLLDEAGEIIPPTILWMDRRATAETAELARNLYLPAYRLNSTYTLPKLLWLARHQPQVLRKVHTILWVKDYIRFRLNGQRLTDVTEAGGAALLDWDTHQWATSRLNAVDIVPSILPPLVQPNEVAAPLLPHIAERFGLNPRARVLVGAGDVLALISGAPSQPGRVTCSLGSSSMVFAPLPAGVSITDPLERIYVYPLLPQPLLGGVSSTTGAALQWAVRALYGENADFNTVVNEALATPPGGEGLIFLPFLSGERSPYWNDALRAGFYGLTLAHQRPHLVRAVMEGVMFSLRYLLDIFAEAGMSIHEIALAGGGAATPGWAQMAADICGLPVVIYSEQETVTRACFAYGAHHLGWYASFEAALAATFGAPQAHHQPQPGVAAVYDSVYDRYRRWADHAAQSMQSIKDTDK
ncbi:MAG: hypothetical protein HPY76_01065 [Anaerolineae bacterium]|nr:hypothetical protein [Anaerolineae bacterium]